MFCQKLDLAQSLIQQSALKATKKARWNDALDMIHDYTEMEVCPFFILVSDFILVVACVFYIRLNQPVVFLLKLKLVYRRICCLYSFMRVVVIELYFSWKNLFTLLIKFLGFSHYVPHTHHHEKARKTFDKIFHKLSSL